MCCRMHCGIAFTSSQKQYASIQNVVCFACQSEETRHTETDPAQPTLSEPQVRKPAAIETQEHGQESQAKVPVSESVGLVAATSLQHRDEVGDLTLVLNVFSQIHTHIGHKNCHPTFFHHWIPL